MKRLISCDDEKFYTHMLKVLSSIGGKSLNYNWLISDIIAYPQDNGELDKLISENQYLFIDNSKLIEILEKRDFQWIWAVFSAIPKQYSIDEVLKYSIPFAEINTLIYQDNNPIIQHPLADIEIVAEDSSSVFIVAKDDDIIEKFKKSYPKSKANY